MTEDALPPTFVRHMIATAPPVLYHYTNQAGLIGIATADTEPGSAQIWATKIQYMNDATEFGLAISIARECLREKIRGSTKDAASDRKRSIYSTAMESLDGIEHINIFASCFCEIGDLLSQWRGYTGGSHGYSIGFNSSVLAASGNRTGFTLGRCIYDPVQQRAVVDEAIEICVQGLPPNNPLRALQHGNLAPLLFRCGAFFKDASFGDEQEWRMVSSPTGITSAGVGFRMGRSMITPYYRLSINQLEQCAVSEIVVGPCPHMDLAHSAVSMLMLNRQFRDFDANIDRVIRKSRIPYRNW